MIITALIMVPLVGGALSFFLRWNFLRRGLLIACASAHFILTASCWIHRPVSFFERWFALDSLGIIFLTITSLLFLGAAIYGVRYLSGEKGPEAAFTGCLLLFLSTMTAVTVSQHLGVLWVAIEATTLASAPLIYFHRTRRSLEATWKYLLICSVGIALALLGIFFLAAAGADNSSTLILKEVIQNAARMNIPWLKAAFLFIFVGYGTKMGLAPFHTWLPDAHSEAPSVVSALLSGALLNCAFLGVLRVYQICAAAGLAEYSREIFVLFGLVSLLFASFFILGQMDYKRMLAYSSIEHMGILTLGAGLGGGACLGVVFGLIGHSLTKAGLFFTAGNILSHYRTKYIPNVKGLFKNETRVLAVLWFAGFLIITGTPPSGIFLGKFMILKEAVDGGRWWVVTIFLVTLAIVFIGMARIFISMTQEALPEKRPEAIPHVQKKFCGIVPTIIFFVLVVVMGLYLPVWFSQALSDAAKELVR